MNIQPIVEGHGEVQAVPALLRRLCIEVGAVHVGVNRPLRRNRSQLLQESGVRQVVQLARLQKECGAILVLFDGDDDCPANVGPLVRRWAITEAREIPCEVVIAHREYEAWFLAAIESLRGRRGIRNDTPLHLHPEEPRNAKQEIRIRMDPGRSYLETADQPALSAMFDLGAAHQASRSFRKLTKAFGTLVQGLGHPLAGWPPPEWNC